MTSITNNVPAAAPKRERSRLVRLYDRIQNRFEERFLYLGGLTDLGVQTVQQALRGPIERDIVMTQFEQIGVKSMSIVGITSLFIGKIVSLSLVRELAPVLMSLMVGGRVGAGITAEIGTMKVTEQIDALRALATNPVRKLVVPKVLACTIMLPLLTSIACLNLTANFYTRSVIETLKYNDLASGIGKTFFFGFAIGLIGCYNGLRTTGGADGVGRATTATVVTASITVLIMDFFLTKLFLLFS